MLVSVARLFDRGGYLLYVYCYDLIVLCEFDDLQGYGYSDDYFATWWFGVFECVVALSYGI